MTAHDLIHRLVGHRHGAHSRDHKVMVGRRAAAFDRLSGWALGWLYRTVANRVVENLPTGGAVLDVGTGPGRLLVELARRRPDVRVVGIDPSADMIGHADDRLRATGLNDRAETRVAGAEDLPFGDGSFDAVTSTLSAHHWADVTAAVAAQARVLLPGGQLWVFDLRGKASADVRDALEATFGADAVTDERLGRLRDRLLVCHRAMKPSVHALAAAS